MDIYFSTQDRSKVMRIPVIPETIADIVRPQKNEEFEGTEGSINLLGTEGLFTLSLQSFFPIRDYPFAKDNTNGWEYVNFFNSIKKSRQPLRLLISYGKRNVINELITIENFTYSINKVGDIEYTLDIKQFKNF